MRAASEPSELAQGTGRELGMIVGGLDKAPCVPEALTDRG
jgi:hypothetical protein